MKLKWILFLVLSLIVLFSAIAAAQTSAETSCGANVPHDMTMFITSEEVPTLGICSVVAPIVDGMSATYVGLPDHNYEISLTEGSHTVVAEQSIEVQIDMLAVGETHEAGSVTVLASSFPLGVVSYQIADRAYAGMTGWAPNVSNNDGWWSWANTSWGAPDGTIRNFVRSHQIVPPPDRCADVPLQPTVIAVDQTTLAFCYAESYSLTFEGQAVSKLADPTGEYHELATVSTMQSDHLYSTELSDGHDTLFAQTWMVNAWQSAAYNRLNMSAGASTVFVVSYNHRLQNIAPKEYLLGVHTITGVGYDAQQDWGAFGREWWNDGWTTTANWGLVTHLNIQPTPLTYVCDASSPVPSIHADNGIVGLCGFQNTEIAVDGNILVKQADISGRFDEVVYVDWHDGAQVSVTSPMWVEIATLYEVTEGETLNVNSLTLTSAYGETYVAAYTKGAGFGERAFSVNGGGYDVAPLSWEQFEFEWWNGFDWTAMANWLQYTHFRLNQVRWDVFIPFLSNDFDGRVCYQRLPEMPLAVWLPENKIGICATSQPTLEGNSALPVGGHPFYNWEVAAVDGTYVLAADMVVRTIVVDEATTFADNLIATTGSGLEAVVSHTFSGGKVYTLLGGGYGIVQQNWGDTLKYWNFMSNTWQNNWSEDATVDQLTIIKVTQVN